MTPSKPSSKSRLSGAAVTLAAALALLAPAGAISAAPGASLAPAAASPDAPAPPKPKDPSVPDVVERVTIASRLAEEARKGHSALALAAAAEILAACRTAESKRSKATQGGPGGEQDASASASSLFEKAPQGGQWDEQDARAAAPPSAEAAPDPASLFEEAAAIARTDSNEPLAAAIETAASVSLGGGRPADGRGESHADRIRPHSTDIYVVRFAGGETARATVVTNSGQDVDIFVYDMEDKLVAYDNGLNTTGACSWIPDKSAEYSVRVTNTNGVTVDYTLFTN